MDPLFHIGWIASTLERDLILLENQIPFFILEHLHSVIGDGNTPDPLLLIFMTVNYFPIYQYLPPALCTLAEEIASQSISHLAARPLFSTALPSALPSRRLDPEKLYDFRHLVDLVRKFMLLEETLVSTENGAYGQEARRACPYIGTNMYRYSASELSDLGVRFKDYTHFMDGLINTSKDIELLQHHGIIESFMGDDEAIATMFNNICKNRIFSSNYYYAKLVRDLTMHCRKRRNVWMAKLWRNYLSSPWAILSVLAASVLLILTATQTVYSAYCSAK
ncbi:UPF0481 protein At3g47200-like [Punica granatum]|uniref:UPF0481 protein At3g47200-like n=1 Tax=Punica granatum TaxID=22663 RepID=A0A6P8DUG3_PUNGR|nr:UPF0481 protein At3g47200-like [Punica granatum]